MKDTIHQLDDDLWAAHVRGPIRLDDALFAAKRASRIAPIQLVRADRILGAEHVKAAAKASTRAIREGRSQAKHPEVEFTRYLAGERQIGNALDKMGITDGLPTAIAIALGTKGRDAIQYLVNDLGLQTLPELPGATLEALHAFGITQAQLDATTPARHLDLALEAVARVDLM